MRNSMAGGPGHSVEAHVTKARSHTIGDLLRRTALRYPDKTALVAGDFRETYAQLNATVNATAHALSDRGVVKGDRIALLSHNCREFVVVYLALAKLGAILVPVNFMLTAEEIAFILDHCEVSGLVTEDALAPIAERALTVAGRGVALAGLISSGAAEQGAAERGTAGRWEDVTSWLAHADTSEPDVAIGDDDPVRLMYTSGTESRPKGVVLTSRSLIAQYVSCIIEGELSPDDIDIQALPFYHCAQLDGCLTPAIYLGATSVILPSADPAAILAAVERERATRLFCPPTVWIGLLRCPTFESHDLSSLRKGIYGAAPMPVEVLREIRQRLPELRLWNLYGQTEMAPVATVLPPDLQEAKAGSAGRPVLNVETMVVDDDDMPVPAGTVGEIVHRSPHAMLGYYKDPEKTAEAFRNGWFHSGDLGVFDADGYLTVVDRKKDMIKTGGENVASREVEEAIYGHPAVAEVAVFGIAHPYWIEAVTAVVVARPGAAIAPEEIIDYARGCLASYKTPKYVVVTDQLPKSPSGKILKRELRTIHAHLAGAVVP
ncbi:fatty acyl-CoA synthetase [Frankia sp. Cas3]|uniref:fatty acyl-CoA synthetase n=1 Tax=Frankia sp. Cas3 TaxID=3073926 RepID=UPI002AD4466B|nr:fatty acyl-CoA synthetase [Frankia sp. Cas3]